MTRLEQLSALGQSVWIDFLSRDLIESGAPRTRDRGRRRRRRHLEPDASSSKALSQGTAYDAQIAGSDGDVTSVFHALAMRDVAAACDVLRPVWERTGGRDGYVSIEVDPTLAADTEARSPRRPTSTTRSPGRTCS